MQAYCDQGHGGHDPEHGCGPCVDEQLAGLGDRPYAMPQDVRLWAERVSR